MTFEELLVLFFTRGTLLIKIPVAILSLLHLAFSILLLRQTTLMNKVVEADISPVISGLALIHLASSLFIFGWIMIFL